MSSTKAWECTVILLLLLFLSCSSILVGADNRTHPVEVEALRNIKKSLVDIKKNLSNWKRGDPCTSHWTGVLCFNTTMDDGYLHVRELQLLNMNLSGTLSPELGRLSYMKILDFMWNNISGSIPREIGNIKSLELLLLNGNNLTGSLPEELGSLPNLDRIQIDQNHISGPIPKSFAYLNKTKHFHMNNNSISGQIPPELSRLPNLVHFLLDNNNLTGYLPRELSELPKLLILQLDNNNFAGSTIPASYRNMSQLLKLSLRNCSLEGTIPDLSPIPGLGYLDLSSNKLNGSIPQNRLALNITTIDLSNNNLTGTIPTSFSDLPYLQRLLLANNSLNGSVPSIIWQSRNLNANETFTLDIQNNNLSNISSSSGLSPSLVPPNVTVWLGGNPLCLTSNFVQLCGAGGGNENDIPMSTNYTFNCSRCPTYYEYSRTSPVPCLCASPLLFDYRLKSPGFSYFPPYENMFQGYLTTGLNLHLDQLNIDTYDWQSGPRLGMHLKIFPEYSKNSNNSNEFNDSEVRRIVSKFTGWTIPDSEIFGPYELIRFTLLGPYNNGKGALAGIILGTVAGAVTLSAIVALVIVRRHLKDYRAVSKRRRSSTSSIKIDGVRSFSYGEMATATNNFDSSSQVGQGGYGKVYKGILGDGMVVAIKRAQEGSLQGEKEFLTEIQFLSRLHHRNLVSLVGYCDEEGEQMLVYEFMTNGTLKDNLSAMSMKPPAFDMRLSIALGSSRGILYLHTEADPPVFHRDIKASNILLDHKFTAKVADFGLSRLAPVPDIEGVVPAHVSTVVKGTPGYLDPEYFLTHKLTDKSDVYSLGVVFLELLTGMQPISHGKNIVREVNTSYQSGMIFSSIDGRMGSYPSECVEKFVMLALKCCEDEPAGRPSMAEIVRELENIWSMMPESDSNSREFPSNDPLKKVSPPTSSTMLKNPYVSSDVSGSDLVSGVIPTITPR